MRISELLQLVFKFGIALAESRGVDQDQSPIRESCQQWHEFASTLDCIGRHAQQTAQGVDLFGRANAHRVGRHQRDIARSMLHYPARRELGQQRGLADTRRTHQRHHATLSQPGVFYGFDAPGQQRQHQALCFAQFEIRRDLGDQLRGQIAAQAIGRKLPKQFRLQWRPPCQIVPRQRCQLGFEHAPQGFQFIAHGPCRFSLCRPGQCGKFGGEIFALRHFRHRVDLRIRVTARLRRRLLGTRVRGLFIVDSRLDFNTAVDAASGKNHGVRTLLFTHLAQCLAHVASKIALDLHERVTRGDSE